MTGKKPDISNVPAWGCCVHVHDTSSSKLDGWSKVGHWVGFDDKSDAHRIYWAEKHSVTVDYSMKFNFKDEDIPVTVMLEGEWEDVQVEQSLSNPYKATIEEIPDHKATTPCLNVEPEEGCPKHMVSSLTI
jgi:hypothetical protein